MYKHKKTEKNEVHRSSLLHYTLKNITFFSFPWQNMEQKGGNVLLVLSL